MLEWIAANKNWLFEGIGVAVPVAIIGWLFSRRKDKTGKSDGEARQQSPIMIHTGSGDNIVGDKNINKE